MHWVWHALPPQYGSKQAAAHKWFRNLLLRASRNASLAPRELPELVLATLELPKLDDESDDRRVCVPKLDETAETPAETDASSTGRFLVVPAVGGKSKVVVSGQKTSTLDSHLSARTIGNRSSSTKWMGPTTATCWEFPICYDICERPFRNGFHGRSCEYA